MNKTNFVGRLTKDPELKYLPNGTPKAAFTLAVKRNFKSAQGEPEADFIRCTAWNKQAENVSNFMKKGSLISVSGRLQTSSYDNQQGQKVYTWEIVVDEVGFLESKKDSAQPQQPVQQPTYNQQNGFVQQQTQQQYPAQPYNQGQQTAQGQYQVEQDLPF
jgi:single-strand DNA-binding protein